MSSKLLEGQVAIVTGAGRGIGREVALAMAKQGAAVLVNDVGAALSGAASGDSPAEEVVALIESEGGKAAVNTDSVSSWEGAQRIVNQARETFGRVDIIVNNAGILRDGIVHKMSPKDFEDVLAVHLFGSFYVSRAAAEIFREQNSGCFIHMTSSAGLIGNIGQANYMAAKMGIVGLSRALAQDLERYNIRSNCIAPFAKTRMTEGVNVPEDKKEARAQRIAGWRTDAVATLAVTLASDACKDVSGQIFGARGGEVFVFSQPRPVRSVHKEGGWTPELLGSVLPKFAPVFSPLSELTMTWDSVD
ncbi:SDR family NAD(P)-dependent oxidoreductase [Cupriavidus pauculus]|uniref:SDR family NAD(P)-dependent oxidoreductase n=1 Tax=Cupriavidus pauculus TaxID=82633 RepID=UPI001FD0B271|nr:SDR family NAD(P)-dependent oxidoreductase [Cupriavidus pauculus]